MLINSTVTNKWPLNENSQKDNFKLAFGIIKSNEVINVTPWFLCRDFFNDFLINHMAHIHGYDLHFYEIYRYNFEDSWKYNKDNLVLLINDWKEKDNDQLFLQYLNDWEEKYDSKSTIQLVDDILVIKFPRFWVNNHILFSIYTFFVRFLVNVVKGNYTIEHVKLKNLHYSDHDIFYRWKGDKNIFELFNFDKLIIALKNITEESTEYMNSIDNILTNGYDEYEYRNLEEFIEEHTSYNMHDFGFVKYLENHYNEYKF